MPTREKKPLHAPSCSPPPVQYEEDRPTFSRLLEEQVKCVAVERGGGTCATRDRGSATVGTRAGTVGAVGARLGDKEVGAWWRKGTLREGTKGVGEDLVAGRGNPGQAAPPPLVLIQLRAAPRFKGRPCGSRPFLVSL